MIHIPLDNHIVNGNDVGLRIETYEGLVHLRCEAEAGLEARPADRSLTASEARELAAVLVHYAGVIDG